MHANTELQAAREQLVSYCGRLIADGLAVGASGNMSVRVGDLIAITPSGVRYSELIPSDICVVTLTGEEVDAGETPSSELPMHLAVYQGTSAAAVVHTHSAEVIALSAANDELPAVHYAIAGLGGPIRVAGYTRFGSAGLAEAAVAALADRSAAILENHGAICYGRTLAEAYDRALLLEWLARVFRLACSYGEPHILTQAELDEVVSRSAPTPLRRTAPAVSRPRVAVVGPHIVDVLGLPVEAIPAGQGSARLTEIRATAAGTAAGTAVDLAKLGASVSVFGAIGADLLGDILLMALAGYQIDTSGLIRKNAAQTSATILPIRPNGERPAWHVPGATRLLELADLELARLADCDAMLLGGPDAMAGPDGR